MIRVVEEQRYKPIVYREILRHGRKRVVVSVPIVVHEIKFDGKWKSFYSSRTCRKIQRAVEKAWPGWYHRIRNGKCLKSCQACKRKRET